MLKLHDADTLIITSLLVLGLAVPVFAQEAEDSQDDAEPAAEILPLDTAAATDAEDTEVAAEQEEAVEEIIVVAPRPGSRRRTIEFDDPERARLLRELYASREDQAELARLAALADEQDRRIRLGYNPELEREPDLSEQMAVPQRETTQPATIFTIQW